MSKKLRKNRPAGQTPALSRSTGLENASKACPKSRMFLSRRKIPPVRGTSVVKRPAQFFQLFIYRPEVILDPPHVSLPHNYLDQLKTRGQKLASTPRYGPRLRAPKNSREYKLDAARLYVFFLFVLFFFSLPAFVCFVYIFLLFSS